MAIAVATNYHFRPQVGEWPFWTWPWLHVATIANIARWLLNCFEHSEVVVLAVAFSSSMLDEGNPKRWSNIWGWKIRRTITPYYMWNLKHPCKNGCFHFDDEPNLHMKNAWTSPFPSIWTWLLRVPGIIHIYIYIYKELPWLRWLIHLEPPDVRLCRAIPPPNPVALPAPDLDFIPFKSGVTFKVTTVHPRKLTWNPKMMIWKMSFPFPVGDFQVPC